MGPESIVAIVSVIVTGIVSILNGFVPMLSDSRKAKREEAAAERDRMAAEVERIDQTTLDLLGHLSHFRHWDITDIELSSHEPAQRAYSELRAKHYAWERAIWSRLDDGTRERVRSLRRKFEEVHTPDQLKDEVSECSEEILSITYIATSCV